MFCCYFCLIIKSSRRLRVDQLAGHIRLRELSAPQLVRAVVHQHSQRAAAVLLQSARVRLGDAGVHERGHRRRLGRRHSRHVCGQQARARHVPRQAHGSARPTRRGGQVSARLRLHARREVPPQHQGALLSQAQVQRSPLRHSALRRPGEIRLLSFY